MPTNEIEYFATCLAGCEGILARELEKLGIKRVRPLKSGVAFFGSVADGERACLWSRVASRITVVLGRVNAGDANLLHAGVYELPWEEIVRSGASVIVRAHGMNDQLRNSHFTAQKVKDALCDRMRSKLGVRPNVDAESADLSVDVRVRDDKATISLDMVGESLHKRPYFDHRDDADAALACSEAAALLLTARADERLLAGWGLLDPACDDGFVVVEAACMAADLAPNLMRRRWGFFGWGAHKDLDWRRIVAQADERFQRGLARLLEESGAEKAMDTPDNDRVRIVGLSASSPAIARAREHLRNAGLRAVASIQVAAIGDMQGVLDRLSAAVGCEASVVEVSSADSTEAVEDLPIPDDAVFDPTLVEEAQAEGAAVDAPADEAGAEDAGATVDAELAEAGADGSEAPADGLTASDDDAAGAVEGAPTDDAEGDTAAVPADADAAAGAEPCADDAAHAAVAADEEAPEASESPALLIVRCGSADRSADDARAVSEEVAFTTASRLAPAGSVFVHNGPRSIRARFGVPYAEGFTLGRDRILTYVELYTQQPKDLASIRVPNPQGGNDLIVEVNEENSEQFAARLRKVARERRKWAKREGISCYRVYDADLPDYNVAIDIYEGAYKAKGRTFVHIAEYQAPSSVDPIVARRRFDDVLTLVPVVLGVRPDNVFSKVRERSKGGAQYSRTRRRSYVTYTDEEGSIIEVDLSSYLDTGIFLDHRPTRLMLCEMAQDKRFLNLFAYTGVATVHAAAGGALTTTTVDLSQTYLDWAQRNMQLNGFDGPEHTYVRSDVMRWIREERRARRTYDLVFVDPPTFSNSKSMGKRTWDVQRDHVELLIGVSRLLSDEGVAVFSCNLRTFKPDVETLARYDVELEDITAQTIPHDFERNPRIHKCYLVRHVRKIGSSADEAADALLEESGKADEELREGDRRFSGDRRQGGARRDGDRSPRSDRGASSGRGSGPRRDGGRPGGKPGGDRRGGRPGGDRRGGGTVTYGSDKIPGGKRSWGKRRGGPQKDSRPGGRGGAPSGERRHDDRGGKPEGGGFRSGERPSGSGGFKRDGKPSGSRGGERRSGDRSGRDDRGFRGRNGRGGSGFKGSGPRGGRDGGRDAKGGRGQHGGGSRGPRPGGRSGGQGGRGFDRGGRGSGNRA